jgi:hypothetical protein
VNSVGALFWILVQDAGNCKGVGSPDCYKVVSSAGAVATADHYGSGSFEVGGEHTCMHGCGPGHIIVMMTRSKPPSPHKVHIADRLLRGNMTKCRWWRRSLRLAAWCGRYGCTTTRFTFPGVRVCFVYASVRMCVLGLLVMWSVTNA